MEKQEALVQGLLENPKPSELKEIQIPEITRLEEDVYIHTLQTLDRAAEIRTSFNLERRICLMLSAWLHDVGKWKKTTGHENTGAALVPEILKRELPNKYFWVIPKVTKLVAHHMKPSRLENQGLQSFRNLKNTGVDMWLLGFLSWTIEGRYPKNWLVRNCELKKGHSNK